MALIPRLDRLGALLPNRISGQLIALVLLAMLAVHAIGAELERLTRKPLLRQALRMMRGPAGAAGLTELQSFLEIGFDTFRAMKGADEFLSTVDRRERTLCDALFETSILGRSAKENSDLAQIRRYFSA